MDKEEILRIAKEKYPVGTVFNNKNIRPTSKDNHKIINHNFRFEEGDLLCRDIRHNSYTLFCFISKTWADIISTPVKTYELW